MRINKIVLIGFFWVLASASTWAEEHPNVQKARDEIRAVEYQSALDLLRVALQAGGNDKNALVDIHRMLADSYVTIGKSDEAKNEYKELLALEPNINLGRISPKFLRVFTAAKEELNGERLQLSHQINTNSRNVVITVVSDPTNLVMGARASFTSENGSQNSVKVSGTDVLTIDLPEKSDYVTINVVDENNNWLETFKLGNVAFGSNSSDKSSSNTFSNGANNGSPASNRGPIFTSWWLWAGVAAIGVGGGIFFEIQKQNTMADERAFITANPGITDDDPGLVRIRGRGDRQALYQTISFVGAGAAGAAAIYFFVRGRMKNKESDNSSNFVGPLIYPEGGAGVSARFQF